MATVLSQRTVRAPEAEIVDRGGCVERLSRCDARAPVSVGLRMHGRVTAVFGRVSISGDGTSDDMRSIQSSRLSTALLALTATPFAKPEQEACCTTRCGGLNGATPAL